MYYKCQISNKKKSQEANFSAETTTDADDFALFANAPAQTESLHSLEHAARGTGLYVNLEDKTEFVCFYQNGVISLNSKSLNIRCQRMYK